MKAVCGQEVVAVLASPRDELLKRDILDLERRLGTANREREFCLRQIALLREALTFGVLDPYRAPANVVSGSKP